MCRCVSDQAGKDSVAVNASDSGLKTSCLSPKHKKKFRFQCIYFFMYFHLLSTIFGIISITLLWYDAIHDATCIPVNVYIVIHDIM